jgi:hypothetical protein
MPRELCEQKMSTIGDGNRRSRLPTGCTDEGSEKVWDERKVRTSLHQTFSYSEEVWTRGTQIGVTAIPGRTSWHLPRVATEEVSESTHGCNISGTDTARSRFYLSRAPYQDFGSEWSNHSEEGATWENEEFLCSHHLDFDYYREGTCDCLLSLIGSFVLSNLRTRFCFRGEGCDISSVTVAATVFYNTSTVDLIYMTKLITCLRDPKSLLAFNVSDLNSKFSSSV